MRVLGFRVWGFWVGWEFVGILPPPIMENHMEEKMDNEMQTVYGTQYRVRLYPPDGYSILYTEYCLTGFNHPKTLNPKPKPQTLILKP